MNTVIDDRPAQLNATIDAQTATGGGGAKPPFTVITAIGKERD